MAQSAQNGSTHKRGAHSKQQKVNNNWWSMDHLRWYLVLTVGAFLAIILAIFSIWAVSVALQFIADLFCTAMQWLINILWMYKVGLLIGLAVIAFGIVAIVLIANVREYIRQEKEEAERQREAEIEERIRRRHGL